MLEWQCIGNDPTEWALGTREGARLVGIVAITRRRPSGQWYWNISDERCLFGIEPSADEAMKTVSALFAPQRLVNG